MTFRVWLARAYKMKLVTSGAYVSRFGILLAMPSEFWWVIPFFANAGTYRIEQMCDLKFGFNLVNKDSDGNLAPFKGSWS